MRARQIVNPSVQNSLGQNTSYILAPGANSIPYVAPASQVRRRAGFINNHFWATRYNAAEMNAAGDYPNQSSGGDGLPRWTAGNESLVNQDVVGTRWESRISRGRRSGPSCPPPISVSG